MASNLSSLNGHVIALFNMHNRKSLRQLQMEQLLIKKLQSQKPKA